MARRSAPARPRRSPVLPIALGLVVLLAIVAIVATRGGSDDDGPDAGADVAQVREVEITGQPLPNATGEDDAAVGAAAPVVTGRSFDGTPVTIGEPGEPQLVFFLAHWCPHCQREVPVITRWIEENGMPQGVALKAVSTGVNRDAPNYPPSKWLEREEWPIETLADDATASAGEAFGLSGYPYFVAIDAEGRVVARDSGELGVDGIEALVAAAKA